VQLPVTLLSYEIFSVAKTFDEENFIDICQNYQCIRVETLHWLLHNNQQV